MSYVEGSHCTGGLLNGLGTGPVIVSYVEGSHCTGGLLNGLGTGPVIVSYAEGSHCTGGLLNGLGTGGPVIVSYVEGLHICQPSLTPSIWYSVPLCSQLSFILVLRCMLAL